MKCLIWLVALAANLYLYRYEPFAAAVMFVAFYMFMLDIEGVTVRATWMARCSR